MQELNVARLRQKKQLADLEAVKTREAYALAELELANARRGGGGATSLLNPRWLLGNKG